MNVISKAKITVITAVYNKEKLIHKCVESVLSQSFKDFEYILVDDQSPDNCPKICDDYAKKDSRIKVIHRENGGHALAINSGILQGIGDYYFILDADDYLSDENCFSEMIEIAEENDCDIVLSDFLGVWNNRNKPKKLIFGGLEVMMYLISADIYHPTTRSRLWKKTILNKNNLFKNLICDDEEWTPKAFYKANKVGILPKHIYCRTTPEDSVTQIATEKNYFRKAFDKASTTGVLINFFEKTTISTLQKRVLYKRIISLYLSSLHIYANKVTSNQLKIELLVVLDENKHILKYSKFYDNSRHHLVAWIIRYFGLKGALLFFKVFTR
jgi:glycosyltransferase involved in cell wall biosynthesis